KYTVLIHTGSITDLAGNNVAGYVTRFATDGTSPTVKSSNPANSATNIALTKVITITFSEAIKEGNKWIELVNSHGQIIPITTSISGSTLTITPTNNLTTAIKYTVLIHTGSITDLAGNNIAGYVTRFTTTWCRPVYIISDNIINTATDNARMNQIVAGLAKLGVYAVNWGLGPNTHITVLQSSQVPQNALVVDICGGACAGTIYEMNTTWYKGIKGSRKVFTVFWAPTSVDITGLAFLVRAHDDDFDPASFTGLANPDQYMLNNGYEYIYSGDITAIINRIYEESII
ncbi:MAG: Ig-like domain-containing protein, partial [Methanobacterium paludis]|nr:Ig-like domain-containing protein [Methanobacterium paludis]